MLPVAVFGFNRPLHLQRCLESIEADYRYASDVRVFIFLDGARNSDDLDSVALVKKVAESFRARLPAEIHLHTENLGLRRSIETGVGEILGRFGQVVVIEDDLVLVRGALKYFQEALARYQDNKQIYQISGYQFPLTLSQSPKTGFLPITTSWGWATWDRAWKNYHHSSREEPLPWSDENERKKFDFNGSFPFSEIYEASTRDQVDSWAIHWYASVFLRKGLTCFPSSSLIRNDGFDGSGTHCGVGEISHVELQGLEGRWFSWPDRETETTEWLEPIQQFLRSQQDKGATTKLEKTISKSPIHEILKWFQRIRKRSG